MGFGQNETWFVYVWTVVEDRALSTSIQTYFYSFYSLLFLSFGVSLLLYAKPPCKFNFLQKYSTYGLKRFLTPYNCAYIPMHFTKQWYMWWIVFWKYSIKTMETIMCVIIQWPIQWKSSTVEYGEWNEGTTRRSDTDTLACWRKWGNRCSDDSSTYTDLLQGSQLFLKTTHLLFLPLLLCASLLWLLKQNERSILKHLMPRYTSVRPSLTAQSCLGALQIDSTAMMTMCP